MKQTGFLWVLAIVLTMLATAVAGCGGGDEQPPADGDTDSADLPDGDLEPDTDGDVSPDGDDDIIDNNELEPAEEQETGDPCQSTAECEAGFYCDLAQELCVSGECYDRRDCPDLNDCDILNHTCFFVGCSRDDECEGRCMRATGQCVECLRDSDCPGGICSSDDHTCSTDGCEDDPLEPNDEAREASPVEGGVYDKLRLCSGDEDWYTLFMSVGSALTVHLDTDGSAALQVQLFDADEMGEPLASVNVNGQGDLVLPRANISGDYMLVISSDTAAGTEYSLSVVIQPPTTSCSDDAFEENDTIGTAGTIGEGSFTGLTACPGDPDLFALELNRGDGVDATITGQGVSMVLWNEERAQIAAASGVPLQLSATVPASGRYFLKVDATSLAADYALSWSRTPAVNTCSDDGLEDNDTAATAARIAGGALEGMISCGADADWYSIAETGASISITLFAGRYHPFEVYAANSPGVPLDQSWADTADPSMARLELDEMPPEGLLVKVAPPADDVAVTYDLLWDVSTAGCADDRLEENDTPEDAVLTDSAVYDDLYTCAGDEDWYVVLLNAGDTLDVLVSFDHQQGDLDLDVYNPDGERVAASHTINDDEAAQITATISGFYFMVVYGWRDAETAYDLAIDIEEAPAVCEDDRFENNDSVATAAALEDEEIYGLQVCHGDRDFYSIALNQGDEVSIGVFFDGAQGNLFAKLLSPDGSTTVAVGEAIDGDQIIDATAQTSGAYILEVYGADTETANNYDMIVDITANPNACSDDMYEENDSPQSAIAIAEGTIENLIICPNDDDWFAVYLQEGDSLTATITMADPDAGDLDMLLVGADGHLVLDASASTGATETVTVEDAEQSGMYLVEIEGYEGAANSYTLTIVVDGAGGHQGSVTRSAAPGAALTEDSPVLIEMPFDRVPENAVVSQLTLDGIVVNHSYVKDVVITASFGESGDTLLWNRWGGLNDAGEDDDAEMDEDIELYNRVLDAAAGLSARDTLLIMIEDYGVGDDGTVEVVEATLSWTTP